MNYQYPNEIRTLKNNGLIALVKSKWLDIGRLNVDLRYLLDFDERFARVGATLPDDRQYALLALITNYARLLNEGTSHSI